MSSQTPKLNLKILGANDRLYIAELCQNFGVLDNAVMDDLTINDHPLSGDITLSLSDLGIREMNSAEIDSIIDS